MAQTCHWQPSVESMRVLSQIGYLTEQIEQCCEEYTSLLLEYPELVEANDRAFAVHLAARFPKDSARVQHTLSNQSQWMPSFQQLVLLEREGYWKEVISSQLLDFKIDNLSQRNVIESKYGAFRAFLRKNVPLPLSASIDWYPSQALQALIANTFSVEPPHYSTFWSHFEQCFERTGRASADKPKFFFRYVEANRNPIERKLSGGGVHQPIRRRV